jgi:hypothetical protein
LQDDERVVGWEVFVKRDDAELRFTIDTKYPLAPSHAVLNKSDGKWQPVDVTVLLSFAAWTRVKQGNLRAIVDGLFSNVKSAFLRWIPTVRCPGQSHR